MATNRSKRIAFVVCIDTSEYEASLELHKVYRTIPDPAASGEGLVRVIDESGEDYLYPAERFTPIKVPPVLKRSLLHR